MFKRFVVANAITLLFLTLLQTAEGWLFFLYLLAMHSGIALLIWTKKGFMRFDEKSKAFFHRVYLLLGLYIPILLYKLACAVLSITYHAELVRTAIAAVTVLAAAGLCQNIWRLYRYLFTNPKVQTL